MLKKVPIKKFVHYTIILSLEYGAGVRSNLSLFSFSKLAAVHSNQIKILLSIGNFFKAFKVKFSLRRNLEMERRLKALGFPNADSFNPEGNYLLWTKYCITL
jgi:hypothetical protein